MKQPKPFSSFDFREDLINRDWVVLAPKRAKRPDVASGTQPVCPFCEGHESMTPKEIFRIGKGKANKPGWEIRVTTNKFPFAPVHEIIIHSPNHNDNFFNFSQKKLEKIFRVYKDRYNENAQKGQVVIFHNFGKEGAESLPHSHTQLTAIPPQVVLHIPLMSVPENIFKSSRYFTLFCPPTSRWPYEVWFAPKHRGSNFGSISNDEISDLGKNLQAVLRKMEKVLHPKFGFNFYIYQGGDWYLRLIPRVKILGGFELATGVFVNTTDPASASKQLK